MQERSRQTELSQKAQPGPTTAAARSQAYAAAHAEKARQAKGAASPTLSERQSLIPAWKPTDEARPASRPKGPSSASPALKGGHVTGASLHTHPVHLPGEANISCATCCGRLKF